MRPFKDCACPHCEVQLASVAAVKAILADCDSLFALAFGTGSAIRPETAFQILAGGRLVREHLKEFEGTDG